MGCRNYLCQRVGINGYNGSLYDKGLRYCKTCSISYTHQLITASTACAMVKYCVLIHGILIERIERDVQNVIEGWELKVKEEIITH